MSDDEKAPDVREGAEDDRETIRGSWIAISLAAVVVTGAALGIFQTDASVQESNTARETTRTAVGALRAGVLESDARQLERGITAESDAFQRRRGAAVRRAEAAGAAAPPLSVSELEAIVGPRSDLPRARTAEEVRALALEAERLRLRQTALAETRVTWNDRSTQYTTAIAFLAVAIFLIGFSLVLRGSRRTVFYIAGVVFAVATVGWAAHVYRLAIPMTPDEAIAATARGITESDANRQEPAIAAFTQAIDLDSDYETPYARRAISRVLRENPDYRRTGAVTGGREVLQEAVADTEQALELGGGRDLLSFAFLSILGLYLGEYDDSIAAADEAIAINSELVDIRLVRSAAEVGLGDGEAARATLDEALGLLSGSEPSERTRGLAAQYLTLLEQVIADAPERTALAREMEQQIVARETRFNLGRPVSGQVPAQGSVAVNGLRYADGELRVRIRWTDLPPGTALTAIGFERPTAGGAWVQPRDLALFRSVGGTGGQAAAVPLERTCQPTEVRVDVYLDGAFDRSVTGPGAAPTC